jgi:hypothetical protein
MIYSDDNIRKVEVGDDIHLKPWPDQLYRDDYISSIFGYSGDEHSVYRVKKSFDPYQYADSQRYEGLNSIQKQVLNTTCNNQVTYTLKLSRLIQADVLELITAKAQVSHDTTDEDHFYPYFT